MNKTKTTQRKNPFWKVIAYDLAGVGCLILVPILGPLPGPGGIPLLLAGFGLLAVNHDWADNAIIYTKKHSENMIKIVFPDKTWTKWFWDIGLISIFMFGIWVDSLSELFWFTVLGLLINATATTLFMFNRGRLDWINSQLRKFGKR